MTTVTISSSIKFKDLIKKTISDLADLDVVALYPNLNGVVAKEDINLDFMRSIADDYFAAIDSSEALYVICPAGYIGISVSVQIGYAYAKGKPIIFSEIPTDLGLQSLASTHVSLKDLATLKEMDPAADSDS